MSFNGSGTFNINTAGQPVVANTVISATVFNALTADLATGLTNCITKDGQSTPTANIPMGNNRITNLGAGTAATDAANLGQVQSTAAKLITVTGTDTITGTMSPALTAYAAGQLFYFIANAANTGAMTINIDGLGAKAITRDGSTALIAGDVNTGEIVVICYDGTRFQMINAANSFGNTTINGTLTVTGNTGLQANVSITSALSVGGVFAVTGAATLGSTLSVTGKSDLPTISTASMNAAVAVITTGTVTNLTSTSASVASMNAGVALLTTATVTSLTATGASIASANIGNLQFTAASIASINAGVAVITNLTATSASIASANVGTAVITTGTVTALTVTGASVASANFGNVVTTTERVTNFSATSASIASANAAVALITTGTVTNLTSTSASIASANLGVALVTTGTVTNLTATGASIASANVGTAVITGLTVTNASISSVNAATATLSGNLTLNGGTANQVQYLNASKILSGSSNLTFNGTTLTSNTLVSTNQATIDGIAVGQGAGNVATNTAVGVNAIFSNTTGERNSAFGYATLSTHTTATDNTGLGYGALNATTGSYNTAVGGNSYDNNSSGTYNTGLGYYAGKGNVTGSYNTAVGAQALNSSTASNNTAVGYGAGSAITSGAKNTILGAYSGNQSGLDIRTASNYIVLSDGDGTPRQIIDSSGNLGLGVTPSASNAKTIEVGAVGNSLIGRSAGLFDVTSNAYYNSGYKYAGTGLATLYQQYIGTHAWYTAASGTAGNAISFTQALTLNANGALILQGGDTAANGVGVAFPATQSASSNANTLDDYEEGTWTPTITGSSTAGTISYDNQTGSYTKIGRQVTVSCIADTGVVSAAPTGDLRVSGLPFAAGSGEHFGPISIRGIPFPASTTYVVSRTTSGQTYVDFQACGDNAAASMVQADNLATDDFVRFTITYFV